jgi:hypothetical protein
MQNGDVVDATKEISKAESLSDAKALAVDSLPERLAVLSADGMNSWMASVVQMKAGIPTILIGTYIYVYSVSYIYVYVRMCMYVCMYVCIVCMYKYI